MKVRSRIKWTMLLGALVLGYGVPSVRAQSTIIFIADNLGNVARYDTNAGSGSALGSLSTNFTINQIIGAAYDATTGNVLLFDRYEHKVYVMNGTTGSSSLAFTTGSVVFQGGAVLNGIVYGIDENTQSLAAYDYSGVSQTVSGVRLDSATYNNDHVHTLGLVGTSLQLFYMTSKAGARAIGTDGTPGTVLLAPSAISLSTFEDVDYFNGDYLVASYGSEIYRVDGSTGNHTVMFTSTQLSAMGVTGSVSGVAVIQAVPEPSTWAMLLTGVAFVAVYVRRRTAKRA